VHKSPQNLGCDKLMLVKVDIRDDNDSGSSTRRLIDMQKQWGKARLSSRASARRTRGLPNRTDAGRELATSEVAAHTTGSAPRSLLCLANWRLTKRRRLRAMGTSVTWKSPRRAAFLASTGVVILAVTLTCCSEPTDAGPNPDETSSSSAPTSSPRSTEPSWEDGYTAKQLATYQEALARWTEFESRSEPIYAVGKATPAAKALFEAYYPAPVWQAKFQALEAYERGGVRTDGLPTVLWSKAASITANSATIRQCVDYSTVKTTQDGKTLDPPTGSQLRELHLSRPEGFDFLIYQETFRFKGEIKPCEP
jgi:hypothetical protein